MSSIHKALVSQLQNLARLLSEIDNEIYCHPSHWLSGGSIGQHSRHVIELLQCLLAGYEKGLVNYDGRKRDKQIETNKSNAIEAIAELIPAIIKDDKPLLVEGNFDMDDSSSVTIQSTYERELVYNIEHAVHHMALIRVGLKELNFENIHENFGVAYATAQYRKLCAP